MTKPNLNSTLRSPLPKARTGIQGLDEITGGGLPKGRPTLICGGAGCGKTLLAMEFLVRGATEFDEPGVFVTFEESIEDLVMNVASLGFDLNDLIARKKIILEFIYVDRSEMTETGEYDLEGLFIRLGCAIHNIGAKRVVLDTIESLFAGFSNPLVLRAELRRLFRWLKDKGVTAVITGEKGEKTLTRQGLEEYVSDCVLTLDHRVQAQDSTRRIRIVKYRGSTHGTNEYPFLIDDDGISILPITSLCLQHEISNARVSSGIPRLDAMLGGNGFFRGSSILISGTAGTGKSSISAQFAEAACRRGERVIYFSFEESPAQTMRNMLSIGIDLKPHLDAGLLRFSANRPTFSGLETHLTTMHKEINAFKPDCVVVDPLSSLLIEGKDIEVKSMLMRLVDFLKVNLITGVFTNLTAGGAALERTNVEISSLIDSWILLRNIELSGERNRGLYILKSRGMTHSNQIREFLLTSHGIELRDVYIGSSGVLTGSSRLAQESQEEAAKVAHKQEIEYKQRELANKRTMLEAKISALHAEFALEEAETQRLIEQEILKTVKIERDRFEMAKSRQGDSARSDLGDLIGDLN
jgi:circadian clock protein KaiC